MEKVELPAYLLSVISQDLLVRRARWDRERVSGRKMPKIDRWKPTPVNAADVGLLVSVNGDGDIVQTAPCDTPQGILAVDPGYLVARHNVIEFWNDELSYERDHASHPSFNDLHSVRASQQGMIVAASGTDSISEISDSGEVQWLWWGVEHGFDTDPFGNRRELSPLDDHREILYDTWLQTTHVNSALALNQNVVVATLFHQGCLVSIDRRTGETYILLDGLSRPHAIRRHPSGRLSLADTVRGSGLICDVTGEHGPAAAVRVQVRHRVEVGTRWLQDWHVLDDGVVVAVDGERPAVVFLRTTGEVIRRDEFDPAWYLYEVAIRSADHGSGYP